MLEQQQARPPDIGGQRQGLALHRALRVALRRRRLDLVVKGFDRTSPLHVEGGKVCNRRNLVIPARCGEGPLTIRFADLRRRAVETGGLLSTRPMRW